MNILHIASFNGNIGDNASHNGFHNRLEKIINKKINYKNIEMREFYKSWNLRSFNSSSFIKLCNSHDLVVIGGGNFFELKWDYSATGTTIDISENTLERIKTPIFFNGIGCDISKGASESNIKKFKKFLDILLKKENCFISFREDGSKKVLSSLYGNSYIEKFSFMPDNAFFMNNNLKLNESNLFDKKYIGMNIVSDMIGIRFGSKIKYLDFIEELAILIQNFLNDNIEYNLVLFPHIYSDLEAIYLFLKNIKDDFRRRRIIVGPYLTGNNSDKKIFNMYRSCDVILGMRFHSNICAIAQNIPTIALSSYPKIDFLYDNLNLEKQLTDITNNNFRDKLAIKLKNTIINKEDIKMKYKKINEKLFDQRLEFEKKFEKWLISNSII